MMAIFPAINNASTVQTSLSQGWVKQCDQRGTLDIIWGCSTTLFLCLWVMLHLNVPAKTDGFWTLIFRKSRWLLFGALAPETLLLASAGQWASAKRSKVDMKALGHDQWSMAHGFYADSGGFVLQPPDYGPFPVTAKQVHYLVKGKYIKVPEISEKEILDKSKADQTTKTIACLQSGWFVTQCLARAIEHLPVSPLEITTCAIILCTATTYFFWLNKPLNVLTPTILNLDCGIAEVLTQERESAEKPFWNTPMDFAEPEIYTLDQWPRLSRLCGPYKKPLVRIPNDRNPQLFNVYHHAYLGLLVCCFSTISFIEWNFHFPTEQERLIWRICCVLAEASLFIHGVSERIAYWNTSHHIPLRYIEGYKVLWPWNLVFFVPGTLYFFARMLLVALAFSSLRSLPHGSYINVEWSNFVPHM